MAEVVYRALQVADLEQVHQVALKAWHWTYQHIFDDEFITQFIDTHYAPQRLRQQLVQVEQNQVFFEVATVENQIVGFCNLGRTQHAARLFRIYLLPEHIGRGIGRTLLHRGEAWLRAQGIFEYGCYVHQGNTVGQQFYLREGFQRQPEHDHDDEWYMQKKLADNPAEA